VEGEEEPTEAASITVALLGPGGGEEEEEEEGWLVWVPQPRSGVYVETSIPLVACTCDSSTSTSSSTAIAASSLSPISAGTHVGNG